MSATRPLPAPTRPLREGEHMLRPQEVAERYGVGINRVREDCRSGLVPHRGSMRRLRIHPDTALIAYGGGAR